MQFRDVFMAMFLAVFLLSCGPPIQQEKINAIPTGYPAEKAVLLHCDQSCEAIYNNQKKQLAKRSGDGFRIHTIGTLELAAGIYEMKFVKCHSNSAFSGHVYMSRPVFLAQGKTYFVRSAWETSSGYSRYICNGRIRVEDEAGINITPDYSVDDEHEAALRKHFHPLLQRAKKGEVLAQYTYGLYHPDPSVQRRWLCVAASKGSVDALYGLAQHYSTKVAMSPRARINAYKFFLLAKAARPDRIDPIDPRFWKFEFHVGAFGDIRDAAEEEARKWKPDSVSCQNLEKRGAADTIWEHP
jgi:hypothetical protein